MKNRKNKGLKSRIFMALVAVSMLLFSCACGKEEQVPIDEGSHVPGEEYGYVAEIHTLNKEAFGEFGLRKVVLTEDKVLYSYFPIYNDMVQTRNLSLPDASSVVSFPFEQEGCSVSVSCMGTDATGNVYVVWAGAPAYVDGEEYAYGEEGTWLVKYDSTGKQLECVSVREDLEG